MAELQSQPDWLALELPAQYEILGQVTGGAMGNVFSAQNRYTGAHVAIKIMRSESMQNKTAIQRFFLEAKAASLLKHSNICRVLDFGVNKRGMPYLVMDWAEGVDLEKMIIEGHQFSLPEVLLLFRQVATALAHAHQKKIIHRDLKPENIMVNYNAARQIEIQLIDFGIAKMLGGTENSMRAASQMTQVGMAVGTPAYMSPEQAQGSAVDRRTDIYSLGCVMYFVLSGKPPFCGSTVRQVMEKHLHEPAPAITSALNIPQPLNAIIYKAMSKNVDKRYATMEELVADLDGLTKPTQIVNQPVMRKNNPAKSQLAWVLWFVIGFSIVYGARIAWEYLSATANSNSVSSLNNRKI